MRRDLDLIRKIMLKMADDPEPIYDGDLAIEGYTQEEINFHLLLMVEGGLVHAIDASSSGDIVLFPQRLTWEGYEFLEAARDNTRWEQVKRRLAQTGGFVYELAKPLLLDMAKRELFGNQ